ncbi:CHASE2 domain-containing protein [Desmonostoc muscorum LEGE 12446]|uniref:CHASE2 domain-containing protein n=1 Tax=Desmonostoc muscorum LEGE 12446 TaxID=1828758 RepID=A0A8J7A9E7_DESMC|nr:CHASE2 domain-containing protein [Desmonostoc muscorum]MCF2152122.1 CHASE2 domain-containing protein [Desmonostoc muscorum LEGE 12446]
MVKAIAIDFGVGDLVKGFSGVTATLSQVGKSPFWRCRKSILPPAPELDRVYKRWRLLYQSLSQTLLNTRMEIEEGTIERFSEVELKLLCQELAIKLNDWLDSQDFLRDIKEPLSRKLQETDEIEIVIQTDDPLLRQFPWQLWDFLENYPKAEIALSVPEFDLPPQSPKLTEKVRILAILGNGKGIDLKKDRMQLESLSGVELEFLVEPSRQALNQHLWAEKRWDILFFAGHSQTEGEKGVIALNQTEKLSVDDLKHALKNAIAKGLQLAIFNSCDGLGLAKQLEQLHIPQVIVMRYPVPDAIAHEFLKHFLRAFERNDSLYLAIRQAREQLQGIEDKFPCASWLPVLCQNPALTPLTWKELQKKTGFWHRELKPALGLSVVCMGVVILVRSLAWLQPLELKAYDFLMRLKPPEGVDPRLLLVTVTEDDVQQQPAVERGSASLSDRTLDRLLTKLEQSQVTAIGLDIYRENPVRKEYPALAKRMRESDRFFGLCAYGLPGVVPPPEVPPQRQGFNNILLDSADDVLRRNLLAVESPEPCQSYYSLSFQLAKHHIERSQPDYRFIPNNSNGYIQLGTTPFKTLDSDIGGYRHLDYRGHQILINYRNTPQIAETLTLMDFLERYPSEQIGKRIVLIGTVASSFNDHRWYTPIGKMTGVEVQAHFVSQILSTVLDRRTLIWSLPPWGDFLWIWGWSGVGAILACNVRSRRQRFLSYGFMFAILGGSCWGILLVGGWLPLVPSMIVLGLTGGTTLLKKEFPTKL